MDNTSHRRKNLLQLAVNSLNESAQFCKRIMHDDEVNLKSNLEELENIAKQYSQLDMEYTQFVKNIERTENFFSDDEHLKKIPVVEKFDEFSKEDLTPNNESLSKHQIMVNFFKCIDEVTLENDDIDEGFIPPTDPITKKHIKHPVKNSQCGHVYDKDSIKELISLRKNTRCPYIGCPALQYIKLEQLTEDVALKRKINRYNFKHL